MSGGVCDTARDFSAVLVLSYNDNWEQLSRWHL
jgi:hypothetical protein